MIQFRILDFGFGILDYIENWQKTRRIAFNTVFDILHFLNIKKT